jgi:tetratricopeptide (TPR) repeat protein
LYLEAEDYLFEGEYEKAADEFALVLDYRDAALRSNQSRYQQAMELKQQTKYEDAKAVFEQLGNYSDSAEQVRECQELLIAAEEAALEMIPGGSSVEVDAELETEPLPESEPEIESPWQIVITVNATHETLEDDWAAVEATYQTDGAYHAVYHIQVKGSETGEETLRVRYEITYEDGTRWQRLSVGRYQQR